MNLSLTHYQYIILTKVFDLTAYYVKSIINRNMWLNDNINFLHWNQ